ncbi:RMtype1_S_BamJRS5ORF1993P-TRD1-CR1_like domain containing protein [Comamonadaceae bacterium]
MLLSNLNLLATAPGGVARLRELILTLAVQGKLVPQDPSDESASELLKKIRAEKNRLIAEGKIKRDKPLAEIAQEEKPFELPLGWEWVRNGELLSLRKGKNPKTLSEQPIGKPYLDIEALDRHQIRRYSDETQVVLCSSSDILVVCDGSRSGLVLQGKDGVVGSTLAVIDTPQFIQPYITLIFRAGFQRFNSGMKGAAIPHLDTKAVLGEVTGLPPLTEQSRIITRVEELMRLCDALEAKGQLEVTQHAQLVSTLLATLTESETSAQLAENWHRIATHFDLLLDRPEAVDALEQTILQLAVRGLLVPQDPEDEPASALLKKIRAEKDKLITEGKIKRDKPLPPIAENEQPFELPIGWEWVRLGELFEVASSKRVHANDYVKDGVPFFRSKEIGELGRGVEITTEICISRSQFDSLKVMSGFPKENDLMLTAVGSIGNTWLVDGREFYYKDGNIAKLRGYCGISMQYLREFIRSNFFMSQVTDTVSGTAYNALTIVKLNFMQFPLPPLAEQSRIVTRVAQLRRLCADLRQRLAASQSTQACLAEALVTQ